MIVSSENPQSENPGAAEALEPEASQGSQQPTPIVEYPPFQFENLPPSLRQSLSDCGWAQPMPVQARVIPWLLDGKDVIVQSQTGSGKTGAFLLPLLQRIDPSKPGCQALILVPTRELASQVKTECDRLAGHLGVKSVAVYGGVKYGPQLEAFREGVPIVVGTPGRLLDHLAKKALNLNTLKFLIIDEADEMLSMGFWPDMRRIRSYLPKHRVSAMFSATIPGGVRLMSEEFLTRPAFLGLSEGGIHVAEMDHVYYVADPMQKDRVLMRIIDIENPQSAIIFCNTKSEVEYLTAFLRRFGYDVDQISGDINQRDRENVMGKVKRHELRLLVATDIAARGIDISCLEYVFVYDFPPDFEQYIHRAGRTGRAGNRGIAVSLVSILQELDLKRAAKRHGIPFLRKNTPTPEDVQNRLSERLLARLEADLRDIDTARRERMQGYSRFLAEMREQEHGQDLLLMAIDEIAERIRRGGRPVPEVRAVEPQVQYREQAPRHDRHDRPPRGRGGPHRRRN